MIEHVRRERTKGDARPADRWKASALDGREWIRVWRSLPATRLPGQPAGRGCHVGVALGQSEHVPWWRTNRNLPLLHFQLDYFYGCS